MRDQIEIYRTPDRDIQLEVRFEEDSVWLTQQQMATLFEQTKQNISLHIANCFKEEELVLGSVVKESLTTAADGKKYRTKYYNLDVIISVGYRVKSKRGTQFRQWDTKRLKEYLVEGYAFNRKRLEERNLEIKHLQNGLLRDSAGQTIISNDALASLTLFIAVSKPDEIETVKKVIISVLNRRGLQ